MSAEALQAGAEQPPQLLDPERLPDHLDALYRAARAMCGSRYDAEDLVQETLETVLRRPRWIRSNELGYLLRSLRHNHATRVRNAARRPVMVQLLEHETAPRPDDHLTSRQLMDAIATLPGPYRDAVIAVDVLGLSYREAARSLRARGDAHYPPSPRTAAPRPRAPGRRRAVQLVTRCVLLVR